MNNIFNIPKGLLDAVNEVLQPVGWRRDLDIRPLVLLAGFKRSLSEVYLGDVGDFTTHEAAADDLHSKLSIFDMPTRVKRSIDHYCGSGSVDINHALWHNHLHGSAIPTHLRQHIDNISSALIPTTSVNHVKLYTGLTQSPVNVAGFEWNSSRSEKVVHLPAFTSSSTSFDVAAGFTSNDSTSSHHESDHHGIILPGARHILQLNFHGTLPNAASLMQHSGAKHEEEVLLGPNSKFELDPRPTHISEYHDPIYVWKATYNPDLLGSKHPR